MRARDVSRPRPQDEEAAERDVVVRHRAAASPGHSADGRLPRSPASVPPRRPPAGPMHPPSGEMEGEVGFEVETEDEASFAVETEGEASLAVEPKDEEREDGADRGDQPGGGSSPDAS